MAEAMVQREPRAVTVAHIAGGAGVSRTVFYETFEDLDACFAAAFEWGLARARSAMGEAYASQSRWHDGVRAAVASLLALVAHEPALARLCVVHALGAGTPVLRRRAAAIAALCEYVDRGRFESPARSEPPEVTAEGVVGAVFAVLHNRLLLPDAESDVKDLLGPLMSLIVLPYLGAAAASRELKRPPPRTIEAGASAAGGPERTGMRLTYRTNRVLLVIAERPGASNREVADQAGIVDQGQISRLLRRLEKLGLIENTSEGLARGAPNAWSLTAKGELVRRGVMAREEAIRE